MNKAFKLILKIAGGFILFVMILILTIPVLFKDKIRTKVEQVINESVNARVEFKDYRLGFFKNFPNLAFSLTDLSVTGTGSFENDTLADVGSFNLVFNLSSLFRSSGYEIKTITVEDASINTIVLEDGKANWDIMKDTTESEAEESSGMKILLNKVALLNSEVSYTDFSSAIKASLKGVTADLSGDMTMSETNLKISLEVAELNYMMDGIKYLTRAVADSKIDLLADLDSMKFTFGENYLTVNDLKLYFTGWVAMPGDDIETDLSFNTGQTSFKTLLSLIPAIYTTSYSDLKAIGEFVLNGSAIGVYSDADTTLPDVSLNLEVKNGLVSYPSLPEQISNINLKSRFFIDGKDMDGTTADVENFHMEMAGSPFDMTFSLRTPVSDPDFKGSLTGKIDLGALSKAIPVDSITMTGLIDMSVSMAGRLSMLENEEYEKFKASGTLGVREMMVAMTGYPGFRINRADFKFAPAFAELSGGDMRIGNNSDFELNGRLENYIPYVFKDEILRGNLSLKSKLVDMTEIMSLMATDTSVTDTTSLELIKIPENIDFDFNALVDQFVYGRIRVQNVSGHIIIKDGILTMKENGMDLLGGKIIMNAQYDTRDTLKPSMKADFKMSDVSVKDAFTTFNMVQQIAPAAKGIDGKFSLNLNYSSLLGNNMMPVINTISGGGKIMSDEVTLVESVTYNTMKEVLKLGEKYTNTFKNLNISFKINDGRIFVSPFDVKAGNMKMNISGDQGIDQTLNYIVKTEIPRSELGSSVNSLIDNLSAQATAFGITYRPADIIKVNVKISGTFGKPTVAPFFGDAASTATTGITEGVKETAKQAVVETIDQAKDKARSEAETEADKLIKEAEARGQQLRDEAARAAEKLRNEADIQAQRLITEAESKGTVAKIAARKGADTIKKEADRKAEQLILEADKQAVKLVEEAKVKKEELLEKI